MKQETKAQLKYLRMSPRKARLLVDLVRGMKAVEAVAQLKFSHKVASLPVAKLILSAIANAKHNYGMAPETLVITKAFVDGGPMQYRYTPRAFGRASPIRKRTAHITVVLEGEAGEQKNEKTKKQTDTAEAATEKKEKSVKKEKVAVKKEKK